MSRLIDANTVISIAKGEFNEGDFSKIFWLISHVPTAYNVDGVAEQIKALSLGAHVDRKKAIDIVRGGGVDGKSAISNGHVGNRRIT